ncbi:MAG: zinc ABC transporter substrate-binding protein [Azoarcus sp.]|jgi:zinc/manganese transport system substrate-binding protein|nr:zinc ABC transporter substrate-binding protein [Azoarcus sp.]
MFFLRIRRALACLFVLACSFSGPCARAAEFEVVASFSILGDLVREVGGERIVVHTLIGADADAHSYEARPSDARQLGRARLVFVNGLGFDDWLARLARSSGRASALVVASQGIHPLTMDENDESGDHHNHDEGIDPHAWHDVNNVLRYVDNIEAALVAADPPGAADYHARAEAYRAQLRQLDADIRATIARLPPTRRRIVSSHDAFAYFSRAYGLVFLAPTGVATDAEPSAKGVASLIAQLREKKAAALFVENITDPRMMELIRHESGAVMGGTLYSDALSAPDGPAPSYLELMRHNLATLAAALEADR